MGIIDRLDVKKQSIQASRTAELWLQFIKMMNILRMVFKGELHIQAMYEMMPYFAASGITCKLNAYTYTCSRCISFMKPTQRFPDTSIKGLMLYADQIGSGQEFPLILSLNDQVLMRSMKASGGLT